MVISFFGHSSLYNCNDLFERVKKGITENISVDDNVVFLCGGYGDFDDLCARVCRLIKEERENCEIVFVTPYIIVGQQEKIKNRMSLELYDSIVYPPLEKTPLKFAISKRNEWMIDQADVVVSCITHGWGGAAATLRYAQRKKKRIISVV